MGTSRIVKSPIQMSPNELEVALFNKFLKARFVNGYGFETLVKGSENVLQLPRSVSILLLRGS
jgi:hypothetical protein